MLLSRTCTTASITFANWKTSRLNNQFRSYFVRMPVFSIENENYWTNSCVDHLFERIPAYSPQGPHSVPNCNTCICSAFHSFPTHKIRQFYFQFCYLFVSNVLTLKFFATHEFEHFLNDPLREERKSNFAAKKSYVPCQWMAFNQ